MVTQHVFLTGSPGVGKTTLIKKIVEKLKLSQAKLCGFFTEELRENGSRIGFDVVALNGSRFPLARVENDAVVTHRRQPKVGKYTVRVEEFERYAIPLLNPTSNSGIVILDEIGKMELFSQNFKTQVLKLLNLKNIKVVGTIPIRKGTGINFVEEIRKRHDVKIFEITAENRNKIFEEMYQAILQ